MRVAILADPYVPIPPPKYGGTEQVIINLIKGLQELGHEPVLFAPGDSKVDCELIPTTETSLYFPLKKQDRASHAQRVAEVHRHTELLLADMAANFDVIHSHSVSWRGVDLRKFSNVPNVTTLHGPITFTDIPYFKQYGQLPYVTISENQQQAMPGLNYVGVVYNGQEANLFPFVKEPEDYLCFLGRFDREKNPHMAILLALSLGMKIKIAGKVDHLSEGYFQEEVEPYLDNPLVEYLGEIDFDAKVELVSKARCNLHPTGFREPFGLTIIEAAYCGTPTLAISKGSMPELIEQGRTGLLVEDFIEGYSQIKRCFEMDRSYIASRARRLFNHRTMTAGYVAAYHRVIEQHRLQSQAAIRNVLRSSVSDKHLPPYGVRKPAAF